MGGSGGQVGANGWAGHTWTSVGLLFPTFLTRSSSHRPGFPASGSGVGGPCPWAVLTLVSQWAVIRPFSTVTSAEKVLWERGFRDSRARGWGAPDAPAEKWVSSSSESESRARSRSRVARRPGGGGGSAPAPGTHRSMPPTQLEGRLAHLEAVVPEARGIWAAGRGCSGGRGGKQVCGLPHEQVVVDPGGRLDHGSEGGPAQALAAPAPPTPSPVVEALVDLLAGQEDVGGGQDHFQATAGQRQGPVLKGPHLLRVSRDHHLEGGAGGESRGGDVREVRACCQT